MKALITGGAGFIGSNLALELQKKGFYVVVVDDFSYGDYKNLIGFEGEIIPYNIMEIELKKDFDVIFHQAAITDTRIRNQKTMMRTNVGCFKKLIEFCVENQIPFIYASSAAVYGNAIAPQKEEDAGRPINIYGFSKWVCDCIAKKFIETHESLIIGLRYFNVFGPNEEHKGKMASMVWQLANQMLEGKRPRIFKFGEQKRDQVYVKDVIKANILAMKSKHSCIVNIGTGRAVTFNHIIETLNQVFSFDYEPEYIENPYKKHYQEHTEADLTNAKKFLNYKPKWKFEDAVKDYFGSGNLNFK